MFDKVLILKVVSSEKPSVYIWLNGISIRMEYDSRYEQPRGHGLRPPSPTAQSVR